jgi:hypothetical protein
MKRSEVLTICCALPSIDVAQRRSERRYQRSSPTLPGSATARRLAGEPTIARVPPSTRHGLQPRRRVAVSGDERAAFQLTELHSLPQPG